jgi:hypothetical protein
MRKFSLPRLIRPEDQRGDPVSCLVPRRDERGVRKLKLGRSRKLPLQIGLSWLLVGLGEFGIGFWLWRVNGFSGSLGGGIVEMFALILCLGALFAASAVLFLRLYFRVRKLVSMADLARLLGRSPEELAALAQARSVRPRYCIDGEDMYAPSDLGDVGTLLRASVAPEPSKESLLRPASGAADLAPETLLRPEISSRPEIAPAVTTTDAGETTVVQRVE